MLKVNCVVRNFIPGKKLHFSNECSILKQFVAKCGHLLYTGNVESNLTKKNILNHMLKILGLWLERYPRVYFKRQETL